MTTAFKYAETNAENFRQQLRDLLCIPSVSTDPEYAEHVQQAAQWIKDDFMRMGLNVEIIPTDRHPLVYAEWLGARANAPTVLIYGHYDVQPAMMEDGWDTDPFEPVEKDGKLFARGASDDKGQMFIHMKAVESLLKTEGKLPVNVKFLIEGEEESGGESIAQYVDENPERLQADVCVVSDGGMLAIDQPSIDYALRGNVTMELHVSGPRRDLHSGSYGGTVHNPLQALTEIISQLHGADGKITVPGFYDDVRSLSDQERNDLAKVPWSDEDWMAETGAPATWGEPEYSLRERVGARPTLEINGMAGGYYGAGFKTVIPAKAIAKMSCRLVADQTPERIFACVHDYITQITPPAIQTELIQLGAGYPSQMDIHDPAMQAAVRAYEQGWGKTPVFTREGGSIPIVADFQSKLKLPVILMGFGLNTDNLHAPNEHYTISMFHKGIDTSIQFLYEYAKMSSS